ncbi:hypothetical protein SLEP1_g59709 [Rubroshorea leprosula]|uniref:Uncharacterized protein n=1 Tax=Rubroshorea leprosula TaxID=152421 RepID=A0AAV5MT51_9ROSI|nr:hypothetical protein SLEP1_g59709 [Rubroshorea leprosula]
MEKQRLARLSYSFHSPSVPILSSIDKTAAIGMTGVDELISLLL